MKCATIHLQAMQVLQELSSPDLLWVSFLPGFSEELLFSGALLPLLGADWWAHTFPTKCTID